ncbi:MAG: FAD binding domain-containing protein [Thermomicrobiales bacterium]|nr:FAD binding domain-containing protein [Thermomicrobiales bacterium]
MNLNTVQELRGARAVEQPDFTWREGDSWLAGGTWLYSEPQANLRRLFDLRDFDWEPLEVSLSGLRIAATCRIAELYALEVPPEWRAASMIGECCRAFLASFKIWNEATVGGNICMSLPASPMTSLGASLEANYTLRALDGSERQVAAVDFTLGPHVTALQPGDLLRAIDIPADVLRRRAAFRRATLTHLGRSTALLVGTAHAPDQPFVLTISAATPRPVQLHFPHVPAAAALREAIHEAIPDDAWFDDVHGSPAYRQHMSLHYAEQIRAELAGDAA